MTARMKGRRMAARMLYEIERVTAHEVSILGRSTHSLLAACRYKGEPQDNIVLRYLKRAAAQGDECVEGFCSVLSDQLGGAAEGVRLDPKTYMRVTERRINQGGTSREQVMRVAARYTMREAKHLTAALH